MRYSCSFIGEYSCCCFCCSSLVSCLMNQSIQCQRSLLFRFVSVQYFSFIFLLHKCRYSMYGVKMKSTRLSVSEFSKWKTTKRMIRWVRAPMHINRALNAIQNNNSRKSIRFDYLEKYINIL